MNRLEIQYNIKELLKDHTDDSLLSTRHILYLFSLYRAKYVRQLYSDRAKEYDASVIQTLCVNMEMVDSGTCGLKTNCNVLRSVERIPEALSIKGRNAITYIGPAAIGSRSFDLVTNESISACMEDEYATTSAFIEDGYVYMAGLTPSIKMIKCIKVKGIFEDPELLEDFTVCNSCTDPSPTACVTDETAYPIPAHMVADVNTEVLKIYLGTDRLEGTRDTENNSVPE